MARFMRMYGYSDPKAVMAMPAKTFLALLGEGAKLEVYDTKRLIQIASYPHMDDAGRADFTKALALPDDFLADILDSERVDDLNLIGDLFEE